MLTSFPTRSKRQTNDDDNVASEYFNKRVYDKCAQLACKRKDCAKFYIKRIGMHYNRAAFGAIYMNTGEGSYRAMRVAGHWLRQSASYVTIREAPHAGDTVVRSTPTDRARTGCARLTPFTIEPAAASRCVRHRSATRGRRGILDLPGRDGDRHSDVSHDVCLSATNQFSSILLDQRYSVGLSQPYAWFLADCSWMVT